MPHDFLSVNRQEIFTAWFLTHTLSSIRRSGLTQGCVLKKVSHRSVWTHVGRCWGLWRLSLDVGSKTACTVRSCVRRRCGDSRRKLLRWRFLKPRTRPCQSDTSPSAGYSYTLQTPRKQNGGHSVSQHVDKVQDISNLTVVSSAAAASGQGHNDWLLIHVN